MYQTFQPCGHPCVSCGRCEHGQKNKGINYQLNSVSYQTESKDLYQ